MQVGGLQSDVDFVKDSGLFDEAWYLNEYPDVAELGMVPLLHYLWLGWRLGRSPGPAFDAQWYLAQNVDVTGMDPLLHYLRHGQLEGREIRPVGFAKGSGDMVAAHAAVRGRIIRDAWRPGARNFVTGWPTVLLCAHASGDYLFGGERSFLDVVDAMTGMHLNVVVTLPDASNATYLAYVIERSVGIHVFAYPQWRESRGVDEAVVLMFADIIARHGVDVVHANTIMLVEPLVAARRMRRIAVAHAREILAEDPDLCKLIGSTPERIMQDVVERCDHIIGNSRLTAAAFSGKVATSTVTNAVDSQGLDLPNVVDGPLRVALISSNLPKKGIADFAEVARLCAEMGCDARFLLTGPETKEVVAMRDAQARGELPRNIEFMGYAESSRDALAQANVVLNLSTFAESFGRTVAEAMAARRPVVAYDRGAVGELVEDGVTGFLVTYRDVEAVAHRVANLCSDPQRLVRMGEAGRARALGAFTLDHLRAQLAGAYRQILGRHGVAAASGLPPTMATVVVPIHDAFEAVRTCLESIDRHLNRDAARLLLVDDASTDPRIYELLEKWSAMRGVRVLRNTENLGYTRSVNIGLREAGRDDVVLLNSDAVVTPQWLEGLRSTAYSGIRIGTVTPMSDNAGAFSFPVEGRANPRPHGVGADDHAARVVQAVAGLEPVEVPTGSGFCMYLRRAMLDEVGSFDEEAFPRGYGEENELCMRAQRAGWKHVVTPRALVYHVRSASFGAERAGLVEQGLQVVATRYPDYLERVRTAFSSPEMQALRRAVQAQWGGEVLDAMQDS